MSAKCLDASQVQRLNDFTRPFIVSGECCAEAAIRRIEELAVEIDGLKRLNAGLMREIDDEIAANA